MRLLVTVAHPDDEAFGCGSLLAHATAGGLSSVVACATRGELGEATEAVGGATLSPEQLGLVREAELRAATTLLGVHRVEVLGWRDSGVEGTPEPGSLCAAPAADVEATIASLIDEVRPHVVVTLDGSDGHRDHAVVRDATLAAVRRAAWHPERTYLWCLPRSLLATFTGDPSLGTPDEVITTSVDVSAHLGLRWQAMRAHASQTPPYDAMPTDLQHAFLATDHLVRVDPEWRGGRVETDWRPMARLHGTAGRRFVAQRA